MSAQVVRLTFRIGARTLLSVPRRMARIGLSLDAVLAERLPPLPPIAPGDDGWLVNSVPATRVPALHRAASGTVLQIRQAYMRYWFALDRPFAEWLAGLSGNARAAIRRKRKKFAEVSGGAIDVRAYRTADELAAFHALAREVSALTYQERLMDAGLPDTAAFRAELAARGAADSARAWLLFLEGRAVAYLYCPADGDTLIYDRLGYDPALAELSPGTVLQAAAFEQLMGEGRFARFDFTEGEGQHKRQFASGAVPCADILLLRPTLANRVTMGVLARFDGAVAQAKKLTNLSALRPLTRRLRRA